jgi:membrane dipeptidase
MAIVVDAHSDILTDIYPRRILGERQVLERHWIPKMRKGGIDIRVVALYTDAQYLPELALRRALDLIATLYEEIDECSGAMLCRTYEDILRAKREEKIGFIIDMEGAEPLGSDLQLLRIFYALGLRVLGFTHALRTYLADGAFLYPKKTGQVGGLTDVGVAFLDQAQSMGIVIDVSHLNDPSFWDLVNFTRAPIIASHSNCRALSDHARNLADDQIKAVVETGGVIGVNACSVFVQGGTIRDLMDHIDRLVNVGGIEHVGLGLDFADYMVQYMTECERSRFSIAGMRPVEGLAGDEDVPIIADKLRKRSYKAADIDRIMGENFVRLFRDVLRPAGQQGN